MMRWYDWSFAIIAADFMLAGITMLLFAPNPLLQVVGAISVWTISEIWDFYCRFRKKQENNR